MDGAAGLSEYELRRLKRIEENKSKVLFWRIAFFDVLVSLGMVLTRGAT